MKTKKAAIIIPGLLILTSFLTVIPVATAQNKKSISIDGAGLAADVIQTYAQLYTKDRPNCSLVVTGSNSGLGLQRLINGQIEMAMASRKITEEEAKKAEEIGLTLKSKYLGQIGLAVITNAKNSIDELTMQQLAGIFSGDIINWNKVGGPDEPIKVTIRAVPETGAGVLFQEKVLKGAPYAKDSAVMTSYNTTVMVCAKSYAIGYVPTISHFFDRMKERGVKIINIKEDGNSPLYQMPTGVTMETRYPISLSLFLYWNSRNYDPCVSEFAAFSEKQAK
jgi:phosphate transport system substrate-binding protein